MSISTKTGDAGTTALLFNRRVAQGMLKDARPDRFEESSPWWRCTVGPDGPDPRLLQAQARRKIRLSRSAHRVHPSETYGIMVYQEQVMQMAQIVGGYSLGGADMLRRAMGKKKAEKWPSTARSSARAPQGRPDGGQGRRDLRPDGKVCGLRLQQVARGRLRAVVLPHRLPEGAPHGRLHGRQLVAGDGRHRQDQDPGRGCD